MSKCKILIVEDDAFFAENLKLQLILHGYEVVAILNSAEAALEQFTFLEPELVLMDVMLAGAMDGIEAAQRIRDKYSVPVLYLTAHSDDEFLSRAKITEPYAYILKPFNERELILSIEMALYKHLTDQKLIKNYANLADAQRIAHLGNWNWDIINDTISWSDEIFRIFGLDKDSFDASYEGFMTSVHPDDRQMVKDATDAAVKQERPYELDHRIILPDGSQKTVHEKGEVKFDNKGQAVSMIGTVHDVTLARQQEANLRIYASVFENANEGVIVLDRNYKNTLVNDAYCKFTGYSREELIGNKPRIPKLPYHDQAFYRTLWDTVEETGSWQGEIWDERKNGEIYPTWMSITAIKDSAGNFGHYVGILTDISELKEKEEQLHQLAFFDMLTGLANRSHFDERFKLEIAAAHRRGEQLALLYIDLDRFKQVNDNYGHQAGDAILLQASKRMQDCIRETDILFRMGGDEFIGILPSIGSPENAAHVSGNIIEVLSRPFLYDGHKISIGSSIGISLYPHDGDSAEKIIKNADRAMYLSKERGGGHYSFSTTSSEDTIAS